MAYELESLVVGIVTLVVLALTFIFGEDIRRFLRNAHLHVGWKIKSRQITVAAGVDKEGKLEQTESFDVIVWTLEVTNRMHGVLTKPVHKCHAKVRFDHVEAEFDLFWRLPKQEPSQYAIHFGIDQKQSLREQSLKRIGEEYSFELQTNSLLELDILPTMKKEAYFLVTVKDTPYCYIVIQKHERVWATWENDEHLFLKQIDGIPLAFRIPHSIRFWIRFEGQDYFEDVGSKFKLDIRAYDDIRISRRFF